MHILNKFPLIFLCVGDFNFNFYFLKFLDKTKPNNPNKPNEIILPTDIYNYSYNHKHINSNLNNLLLGLYKKNSNNFFFRKKIKNNILKNFLKFLSFNNSFFNFFYTYCFNKNNFLILDSNYSIFYPIYKHMYGYNNLHLYKSFFFIEPKFFILKNWTFYFIKFCKFNKINLLIVPDYNYYINFYKNINGSDLCTSAIVPYFFDDVYVDYPLYSFSFDIFVKIIYISNILYVYSMSFNYLNLIYQYKYINIFYKYLNTI